jgi:chromosome segregation and condensation protein ScpB
VEKKKNNNQILGRKNSLNIRKIFETDTDTIIHSLLNPGWIKEETKKSENKPSKKLKTNKKQNNKQNI